MSAKRAFDLLLAVPLLLLTSPLLVVSGMLVACLDGFPVLFRQERVGRAGRPFQILKLRTMRTLPGPSVTARTDPRITPLGRQLRKLKCDELPQLWNVVRGEMSLVGPRPEVAVHARRHPRWFRSIGDLRPGLTDWSSLAFQDEEGILADHAGESDYYDTVLVPRKIALARLYRRHRSIGLDLALVAATAALVLRLGSVARWLAGARLLRRARSGVGGP